MSRGPIYDGPSLRWLLYGLSAWLNVVFYSFWLRTFYKLGLGDTRWYLRNAGVCYLERAKLSEDLFFLLHDLHPEIIQRLMAPRY